MAKKDKIHELAKKRYDMCMTFESVNRSEGLDDLQMLAGLDHWPKNIKDERELDDRPCLTINKLPSFTDQVLNDSRLNKMAIKIKPAGGEATVDLASTFQGIIQGIERISNADIAYHTAEEGAVNNGFGFFRIITDYADDSSFDQSIFIKRIRNSFTVLYDPAHTEADGRDARFVFITEMVSREEYEEEYGKDITPFGEGTDPSWFEEDRVRIAEYWVKEPTTKTIYLLDDDRIVDAEEWDTVVDDLKEKEQIIHLEPNPQDPNGPPIEVEGPAPEGSGYPEGILNKVPEVIKSRKITVHKVMQYIMDGSRVLETNEWAGKYIPIIPVWGKETVIEDKIYRRGLIRFAKDPQRMYNYFRTAATETVALTPKAPWVAEAKQLRGYEDDWESSNQKNVPVLYYNHRDGVAPPQRQVVTQTAIGEITEANTSDYEMKSTTSMHSPSLGEPSNEISGKAIMARKVEGDTANYTYHDNLKRAIKFAGDILVDLIPRIYDTKRQLLFIDEKEEEKIITVNEEVTDEATGEVHLINDLSIGTYSVVVTTGPSFTTRREEAAQSMLDFIRVAPETAKLFIDLIAENQDWPGAQKIADRIRKLLLPPDIDEEGPPAPPQPSIDDILKQLKASAMNLGNFKRQLEIVEKQRELEDMPRKVAEAGAQGALNATGLIQS